MKGTYSVCSLGPWVRGSLGPCVPGSPPKKNGSVGPWVPGPLVLALGSLGPWVLGSLGPWLLGAWVLGSLGRWVCLGSLGSRALGPCVLGSLGPWVLGSRSLVLGSLGPWVPFPRHHTQKFLSMNVHDVFSQLTPGRLACHFPRPGTFQGVSKNKVGMPGAAASQVVTNVVF